MRRWTRCKGLRSHFGEWAHFKSGRNRWGTCSWLSTTAVRGTWTRQKLWFIAYTGYAYSSLRMPGRLRDSST